MMHRDRSDLSESGSLSLVVLILKHMICIPTTRWERDPGDRHASVCSVLHTETSELQQEASERWRGETNACAVEVFGGDLGVVWHDGSHRAKAPAVAPF